MRRRSTLPGRLQPSTIDVLRLNYCVRYGNRWIPQAIATAKGELIWVVVCQLVLEVCLRLANGLNTGCAYRALNADQDVCTGGIHETSGSGFHAGGVASRSCRSAFGKPAVSNLAARAAGQGLSLGRGYVLASGCALTTAYGGL